MKKILMSLSLALATVIAIPTAINAQDINTSTNTEKSQTCTKEKKDCKDQKCDSTGFCKKGDKKNLDKGCKYKNAKGDKRAHGGKHRKGGKMELRDGQNPLFEGITLTAEQQQQFKALRDQRIAEHQALKAEKEKTKAEKKALKAEQIKEKQAAYNKEVEKILTPEQYKQYQANKAKMEQNRKNNRQ